MSKYILFVDDEIKGYLNDEISVKKSVNELADKLIEEVSNNPTSSPLRVFREHEFSKDGNEGLIKIYSQLLGTYFNGTVSIRHVLKWKKIYEYKHE